MIFKRTTLFVTLFLFLGSVFIASTGFSQSVPSNPEGLEAWRFSQVEQLLYEEEASNSLREAIPALDTTRRSADQAFRASQKRRLTQYNCPQGAALGNVPEHVDANITAARIYQKYGRYFLCIRQYDIAEDTLTKAIALFRKGYGHEALVERSDETYFHEIRDIFDTTIKETVTLMEAASTNRAMDNVRELSATFFGNITLSTDQRITSRNDLIEQLEIAIALTKSAGFLQEEDEAREILRQVLENS